MTARTHDDRPCELGEGPLWHPGRQRLYWFDILGRRLMWREDDEPREARFDEIVSAAGWTGPDTLLIASETRLLHYNLDTGTDETVARLESDNPATRSNDGRADPQGGFWIGTMGKTAEPHAGAIYRYYRGELRKLFERVTIPNAICFAPDGTLAYFTDSRDKRVMVQPLDVAGWPKGEPSVFLDFRGQDFAPDGSVTDAEGNVWNAQWGASRVACFAPDGTPGQTVGFPALQTSCPAFGGENMATLFCTTARENLAAKVIADQPENGRTFAVEVEARGRPEPQVIL